MYSKQRSKSCRFIAALLVFLLLFSLVPTGYTTVEAGQTRHNQQELNVNGEPEETEEKPQDPQEETEEPQDPQEETEESQDPQEETEEAQEETEEPGEAEDPENKEDPESETPPLTRAPMGSPYALGYPIYLYDTLAEPTEVADVLYVEAGDTIELELSPNATMTEKKYYVLSYWTTEEDGTGTRYELGEIIDGDDLIVDEELHLYAQWNKVVQTQTSSWGSSLARTIPIRGTHGAWNETNGVYALNFLLYVLEGEEVEFDNYVILRIPTTEHTDARLQAQKDAGYLHGDIHYVVGTIGKDQVTMTLPDYLIDYVSDQYVNKSTGELIYSVDDLYADDISMYNKLKRDTGDDFRATSYYFMLEGKDFEDIAADMKINEPDERIYVRINEVMTITADHYYDNDAVYRNLRPYAVHSYQEGLVSGDTSLVPGGNVLNGTHINEASFCFVNPDLALDFSLEPKDETVNIGDTVRVKLELAPQNTIYLDDLTVEIYNSFDDSSTKRLSNMSNIDIKVIRYSDGATASVPLSGTDTFVFGAHPSNMSSRVLGGAEKRVFTYTIEFDYVVDADDVFNGVVPLYAATTARTQDNSALYIVERTSSTSYNYTPDVDRYSQKGPTVSVIKYLASDDSGVLRIDGEPISEYEVTYDANQGVGSVVDPDNPYIIGTRVEVLPDDHNIGTSTGVSRTDYEFVGWNTQADGGGTTYQAGDTFVLYQNTTLYAMWQRTGGVHEVTYYANGGQGTVVDVNNPYPEGDTVTVLSNTYNTSPSTGISRTNYTFTGWNTKADGTGTSYQPNDTFEIWEDTKLYAMWTPVDSGNKSYTVVYEGNGGAKSNGNTNYSITVTVGTNHSVLSNSNANLGFAREGYTFRGWSSSASGTVNLAVGSTVSGSANETIYIYALWEKNTNPEPPDRDNYYTVIYRPNGATGGKVPVDSNRYKSGETVTVYGNTGGLTREGYYFNGWGYMSPTGTRFLGGDRFQIYGDVILYALWIPVDEIDEAPKTDSSGGYIRESGVYDRNESSVSLNRKDHIWYITGYPDLSVRPERELTRAEATAIFYRLTLANDKGTVYSCDFTDVDPSNWYYTEIAYMTKHGIISGYPDGSFRGDAPITRAELASLASRYDNLHLGSENPFSDVSDDHWAMAHITSATQKGWLNGYPDGSFRPDENITRAETATLINRVLGRCIELADVPEEARWYTDLPTNHWAYCDLIEASHTHDFERKKAGEMAEIWTGNIFYPYVEGYVHRLQK